MSMRHAAALLILTCALAAPALAEPERPQPPTDAALAAKLAYDAEIADQNRRSEALNVEINRKNAAVEARNRSAKAAFDKATADYRAQVAAQAAANAKVQADYQTQMAAWQTDVAACKAGDVKRCGKPAETKTAETKTAGAAPATKAGQP